VDLPDRTELRRATAVFALGFVIHNADHARRGVAASPEAVVWAGTAVAMLTAVILTVVVLNHHKTPLFVAAASGAIAFGVSLSHLLPKWGVLSDPLPGGAVDGFTWFAVMCEIVGALVLCAASVRALRREGRTAQRVFT
jgi:hypothetical protein